MFPKLGFIDMYSLLISIGIAMCFVYLEIYYRKKQVPRLLISAFEINSLVAIVPGFVFACLFQNLYNFIENPSSFSWSWAMTFYGGLIGGLLFFLLGYFLFIRRKYGPQMHDFLIIAPASITVAHGFGRIGCFLAGCCYGIETDSWLGVTFPGMDHKVFPTNLFEAVFLICLSIVLLSLALKKNCIFNMPIYLMSYGAWRFGIEFIRGDHRGSLIGSLSPSQFWSILLFASGLIYLGCLLLKHRKPKEEKATN
jgi:phosphatidylglycerol:prolipoprotein diacylglycerol transferase